MKIMKRRNNESYISRHKRTNRILLAMLGLWTAFFAVVVIGAVMFVRG